MALSGSLTGVVGGGNCYIRTDWTATQNISANTSAVTVKLYLIVGAGTTIIATGNGWSSVAGSKKTFSHDTETRSSGATYLLSTESWTVNHASDGTGSFSLDGSYTSGFSTVGTLNINSATQTLNTIPRYATINTFTQVPTVDGYVLGATMSLTCDRFYTRLDGGSWVENVISGTSASSTLTGLDSGTSHTLQIKVRATASQLSTESSVATKSTSTHSITSFTVDEVTDVGCNINVEVNDTCDILAVSFDNGTFTNYEEDFTTKTLTVGGTLSSSKEHTVQVKAYAKVSGLSVTSDKVSFTTDGQGSFIGFLW